MQSNPLTFDFWPLNLTVESTPSNIHVVGNTLIWQEGDGGNAALYRTDVRQQIKRLVLNGTGSVTDMEIAPSRGFFDDLPVNPCQNSSCARMCTQSGENKHSCLCGDDYFYRKDLPDCIGNCCSSV